MTNAHDVIVRPVVSEKAYLAAEAERTYTFVVAPSASKPQIRQAIEEIFGVTVTRVNTLNRSGKRVRSRRVNRWSKRPDTKRAMVTLAEGDEIDIYGS